jgi:hypothetical protein
MITIEEALRIALLHSYRRKNKNSNHETGKDYMYQIAMK